MKHWNAGILETKNRILEHCNNGTSWEKRNKKAVIECLNNEAMGYWLLPPKGILPNSFRLLFLEGLD
jgi:hypothetical protein